jgi:hypothetical protein
MCACKETDVRESPNDSTFAGGERQGSHGETCYAVFDENPVSSLPERTVCVGKPDVRRKRWENNIKMGLKEI